MALKNNHYDVIVVGGGLVGLIQSIILAQNGVKTLCLDQFAEENPSKQPYLKRTTAISYASHQLLRAAELWDKIQPLSCPIKSIEVQDGKSPVFLQFDLEENIDAQKAGAFGWVIENHLLQQTLIKRIKSLPQAEYLTGAAVTKIENKDENISVHTSSSENYSALLLIGADGRKSFVRESSNIQVDDFSYNQNAIISIVSHQNAHDNIAIEHFNASGPMAILPMVNDENGMPRSSIIYTEEIDKKDSILTWSDKTFLLFLKQNFPDRYGDIVLASKRVSYPLGYIHATDYIANRIALIGDAAHGIHPVAGQGLNLGLRDVAALTELIVEQQINKQDLGSAKILEKYQKSRKSDNVLMSLFTDGLNKIFSNNNVSLRIGRKVSLKLLNKIKPIKKKIISQSMGTMGKVPDIIKRGKV